MPDYSRRRARSAIALAVLCFSVACSGGPPEPLHERPGERLPVWVTGRPESGPLNPQTRPAGPYGSGDGTGDSRQPQTAGRGDVFPQSVEAIGQAIEADPTRAADLASDDACRALRYHLSARIRRAMLLWLDRFRDMSTETERQLRERVWYAVDDPKLIRDSQIELSAPATETPAEVAGPPLTLVNASVPFSLVLDAAVATFKQVLGNDVPPPDRRTLATLLTTGAK